MGTGKEYKLLYDINDPHDLRSLELPNLKIYCNELREYLIDVVSQTGGHFGSGLGTVELTVALHKVFNTPEDKIIWDVGHQAYPHKIITGRREQLKTIRQLGGISGFLKRNESEYDVFGAGHASTSISAALGVAEGFKLKNINNKVVAVIGDGSMTGGMVYEAMNNCGVLKSNVIVVLNDNEMSISKNVWQFSKYFTEMISQPEYNKIKSAIWKFTGKFENIGDRIRRMAARLESGIKSIITPGMMFEALGFRYFGPFNGHYIGKLVKIFNYVKNLNGPILVHVFTQKGKGYTPAEEDSQKLHGITPFDKITGKIYTEPQQKESYTSFFGKTLVRIAKENINVTAITAAMAEGTGLNYFQKEIPERFYDVGIAEQHAVTFSGGLATEGMIPVVTIYSTFLQRAFDQIIHDICLQNLHIVFAIDRGGLVGADGPTHHGTFDLSYLRLIPNIVIMLPKDENELKDMLYTAINHYDGPIAIRYPRASVVGVELSEEFNKIELGKAEIISEGSDVALLAVGTMVNYSQKTKDILLKKNINCELVNMRFAKPLDFGILDYIAAKFDKIITLEENSVVGGFGAGVLEYFSEKGFTKNVLRIGLPDEFIGHGTIKELHKILKIDVDGIVGRVEDYLKIK
ncbi:MAG: 1-deoxy-D-xylulose-5-phosphate synthase [Ignavibacteriales bacterium]|nr:1-deoxy-D-xylulose-5-phosphate synthase [Ignavibacteriales bacterium]